MLDVMRGPRRHGRPYFVTAPALPLCASVLVSGLAFWTPLGAQVTQSHIKHGVVYSSMIRNQLSSVPPDRIEGLDTAVPAAAAGDELCFLSPLTGIRSPTTGVTSLEVPGKARKDFQRACRFASDKKPTKAEEHLRKALLEDAQYPAAWVLLGQVLKEQKKPEDARSACTQALRIDPDYVPADLCLADLYAVEQRWEDMLRFANAAVALDPVNDPHAYFYAAGAYLGLHRVAEAERSALKAVEIDKSKREPRTHFLLAQIYEIERKPDAEAAQLQEYLKSVTDPQEVAMVKKYLVDLTGNRGNADPEVAAQQSRERLP